MGVEVGESPMLPCGVGVFKMSTIMPPCTPPHPWSHMAAHRLSYWSWKGTHDQRCKLFTRSWSGQIGHRGSWNATPTLQRGHGGQACAQVVASQDATAHYP